MFLFLLPLLFFKLYHIDDWSLRLLLSGSGQGRERPGFSYERSARLHALGRMRCDLTINSLPSFLTISWHMNNCKIAELVAYKYYGELSQKSLVTPFPLQREGLRPVAHRQHLALDISNDECKLGMDTSLRLDESAEVIQDISSEELWQRKTDPLSMYHKNINHCAWHREWGGEQDVTMV